MDNIIELKDVGFIYSNDEDILPLPVLNNINLNIERGSFTAILGHNGSGKSTLAKLLNGLIKPTTGTVLINGMDTKNEEKLFDIRKTVGMVFQNPDNQMVSTIVEEDVAFGPENIGIEPKEIRKRVDNALECVSMSDYKKHDTNRLSGGQKQRIAIAGMLALEPECLVLDEPTAMIDPKGRKEVIQTIKKLNKELNMTIVMITHYMEEASLADRTIVIDDGDVILDGTPREVFSNVEKLKSVGLDVPQPTELVYKLNQAGFNLPDNLLYTDETVEQIIKAL